MNIKAKDLLKVIRVGTANQIKGEIFTEFPCKNSSTSLKIVIDKWYHNFFGKLKNKYYKWLLKRKGICTCGCHITPGFYHCWDSGCCKEAAQGILEKTQELS